METENKYIRTILRLGIILLIWTVVVMAPGLKLPGEHSHNVYLVLSLLYPVLFLIGLLLFYQKQYGGWLILTIVIVDSLTSFVIAMSHSLMRSVNSIVQQLAHNGYIIRVILWIAMMVLLCRKDVRKVYRADDAAIATGVIFGILLSLSLYYGVVYLWRFI